MLQNFSRFATKPNLYQINRVWAKRTFSSLTSEHRTELEDFVPLPPRNASLLRKKHIELVCSFLKDNKETLVLTGAGVSTESGIPDYRSPGGSYSKGHRPTTYGEYMKDVSVRQRYWARNLLGWPRFSSVEPNACHRALAQLESSGWINYIITQNVDHLHHRSGSKHVIELHGAGRTVKCMDCHSIIDREAYQALLVRLNPHFVKRLTDSSAIRPDGDFDLQDSDFSTFHVPPCPKCGGTIKPNVVMFGENVPRPTVDFAMDLVSSSSGLLVVGSSLEVYSSFRFVRAAHERQIPIGIVNIGPTRGDPFAYFKIEERKIGRAHV